MIYIHVTGSIPPGGAIGGKMETKDQKIFWGLKWHELFFPQKLHHLKEKYLKPILSTPTSQPAILVPRTLFPFLLSPTPPPPTQKKQYVLLHRLLRLPPPPAPPHHPYPPLESRLPPIRLPRRIHPRRLPASQRSPGRIRT